MEAAAFRVKTAALRVNAAALGVKTATMMVSAAAFSVKTVSRVRATKQSLHSENKDRDIRLFSIAFGGSILMKLSINLLSLPYIQTFLRTSRQVLSKSIFSGTGTTSQAEQTSQWGESTRHFSQKFKGELPFFFFVKFFFVFGAGMFMLSQTISCHFEVCTCICVHPKRLWARGF